MMKRKIITTIIILAILSTIVIVVANLSLKVKKQGEDVSGFVVEFNGSKRYTDDELEKYFFVDDKDRNPLMFLLTDLFSDKKQIPFVETYDVEIESPFLYKVTIYEKSIVGYLKYMGSNMYFDKDGIVVESSERLLEDVPLITGLEFDSIVLHSKIPVKEKNTFSDLLNVTQCLEKYDIVVDKIHMTKTLEFIITLGNVKVELGINDMMNEKVKDLYDIIPSLLDVNGTLYMNEYKADGSGYTFRKE